MSNKAHWPLDWYFDITSLALQEILIPKTVHKARFRSLRLPIAREFYQTCYFIHDVSNMNYFSKQIEDILRLIFRVDM